MVWSIPLEKVFVSNKKSNKHHRHTHPQPYYNLIGPYTTMHIYVDGVMRFCYVWHKVYEAPDNQKTRWPFWNIKEHEHRH